MNKLVLYNSRFNLAAEVVYTDGEVLQKDSDVKDKNKQILDFIFGVDPITKHPIGDIAMYLSDKVNPEVRLFIESNLLKDMTSNDGLSLDQDTLNAMNKNLTDDDIARFSRNHGESKEDYALRLKDYFEHEKYERTRKREVARLKKIINESE